MDSSVIENVKGGGVKSIGESVGGLVWVRRPNGSWWPGQIVKSDELPESVVVPVRSGSSTAVRLLGHSETSLDWYNLEKSKRVKPFRCGEYDAYIEKAKAAAGINRKAAKYARRSDAITEALKIENAFLSREPLDFCSRANDLGVRRRKSAREPPSMSHGSRADIYKVSEDSDSEDSAESLVDLSQSCKKTNNGRFHKVRPVKLKRQRTSDDSEDDLSEGYKRMRGLEDLGMGVVSNRDAVVGGQVGGSSSLLMSNGGSSSLLMSNGGPVSGSRSLQSSRRMRSPVAHSHDTSRRKDRRRPLTKVLENTAVIPVIYDQLASSSSIPPQGVSNRKASELESDGSNISVIKGAKIPIMPTLAENDSSHSLFDVPFVKEERDSQGILERHVGRQYSNSYEFELKSLTNDRLNELDLASPVDVNSISQQKEGSSKWQRKGKRNSRQIIKDRKSKSDKFMDIDEDDVTLAGVELSDEFSLDLVEKTNSSGVVGSLEAQNSVIPVKSTAEYDMDGFRGSNTLISHSDSQVRGMTPMLPSPVEDSLTPQRFLPYRHSRMKVPSRYREADSPGSKLHSKSLMFDISVRKDSYYGSRHPLVSLMSTTNGKSIVGHPLKVEILDDSLSANLGEVESEATILSGRTNVMGYAVKPLSEAGKFSKRISPLRQQRSIYKSLKHRKNGLQPKTRKLSSLTSHKLVEEKNLILEDCNSNAQACVPVIVVFSRISYALKRPPQGPRPTQGRNSKTANRSQSSAHGNIVEAVNRPPKLFEQDFTETMSGLSRPAQSNIIEAVKQITATSSACS